MPVGHTLALAGDFREELETQKRGAPKLMDHPFWGAAFRKVEEVKTETELVFLLTPRFIDAVDASSLPQSPFGKTSKSPSDRELYSNGHTEVPTCQGDYCPTPDGFSRPANSGAYPGVPQPQFHQAPNAPAVIAPHMSNHQQAPTARKASGFSWPSR